jgi:hypothetical protein
MLKLNGSRETQTFDGFLKNESERRHRRVVVLLMALDFDNKLNYLKADSIELVNGKALNQNLDESSLKNLPETPH